MRRIAITKPNGIRLLTEQKYFKENIEVVPSLSEITVNRNGVYEPDEYSIGFKKVTVDGVKDYDTVFNEGYSLGETEGFQRGYLDGRDAGIEEGKGTGKQEEYDRFWDAYQQNGNRLDYSYAFAGHGWTDETFNPKYDIKPTHASHLFSSCPITNLVGKLDAYNVTLDTSNLVSITYLAQYSNIERLPTLDMRKAPNLSYFLYGNEKLHTIDKIILKDDGSQTFSTYTFFNNTALKEIRFEGVIGKNGLDFSSCPLSYASLESIAHALEYKGDWTGSWVIRVGGDNYGKLGNNLIQEIEGKGWAIE